MTPTALLVDADPVQLAATSSALTQLGYATIFASTFDEARRHVNRAAALSLLVADVRLGQFNGLHVAFRARARHPNVRVIITDRAFDTVLEHETKRLGGAYLAKPFRAEDLVSIISRLVVEQAAQPTSARRWPRKSLSGGVLAAVGSRSARLLDVSYGGLCLEFADEVLESSLPPTMNVELTMLGLSLTMHPVWARAAESPTSWRCGGEVIESDHPSIEQWRQFVDSYVLT
jgi:DNA-binding response OmpR family regulator